MPESNDAYELSLAAFSPVGHKRSGRRDSLDVARREPRFAGRADARSDGEGEPGTPSRTRVRERAVELTRELAAMHLARVEDVQSRLAAKGHAPPDAQALAAKLPDPICSKPTAPATGSNEQYLFSLRTAMRSTAAADRARQLGADVCIRSPSR